MDEGKMVGIELQTVINWGLVLGGAVCGWYVKSMQSSVRNLQQRDQQLSDEMHSIHVLVAGNYVTNERLDQLNQALFKKLDRIEDKLDGKQDKP